MGEALSVPSARGDRPRKIIVCSKSDYPRVQQAVTKLGHGDVLVRPSDLVDDGTTYVIDARLLDGIF